jgi:hypothetical protein
MTQGISGSDPALQPAAAAARQTEFGVEATRKALDHVLLEGRLAVQLIEQAAAAVPATAEPSHKGSIVDRTA